MLECMYCGKVNHYAPMYAILRQRKKYEKRIKIGYCCEECESKGKPTEIKEWIKQGEPK